MLQDHGEKMKKIVLNIPLPNCSDIVTYAADNKADFKRPASYIHFKVEDPSERLYATALSRNISVFVAFNSHLTASAGTNSTTRIFCSWPSYSPPSAAFARIQSWRMCSTCSRRRVTAAAALRPSLWRNERTSNLRFLLQFTIFGPKSARGGANRSFDDSNRRRR